MSIRRRNKLKNEPIVILVLILVLALFLRIWRISELPIFYGDEIDQYFHTVMIRNYNPFLYVLKIPFLIGVVTGPTIAYMLMISTYLFGESVFAIRLPSVIIGSASVILIYFFTKDFYDKKTAILSSFILAVFPGHVFMSRQAFEHILIPFFMLTALYSLVKFCKKEDKKYLYLFALSCGLGMTSRLTFAFFLVPLALTIGMKLFKIKLTGYGIKELTIFILFFLIGVYPLIFQGQGLLRMFFESFPVTQFGVDMFDVRTNILDGFTKKFVSFMNPFGYNGGILGPNFLTISLFFSTIFLTNQFLGMNREFKKNDFFIVVTFFMTLIFISSVTITTFKAKDYLMLAPLISIIVARGIQEARAVTGNTMYRILFYIIVFFIFLGVIKYEVRYVMFFSMPSKLEDEINKLIDYVVETEHHDIISEVMLINDMWWYMLQRGYNEEFVDVERGLLEAKEDDMFIFWKHYEIFPHKEPSSVKNVLDILKKQNKSVVFEDLSHNEILNENFIIFFAMNSTATI